MAERVPPWRTLPVPHKQEDKDPNEEPLLNSSKGRKSGIENDLFFSEESLEQDAGNSKAPPGNSLLTRLLVQVNNQKI